jgi:hypothetical protein
MLGPELSRFSRKYFFAGAFVAYVLISAYAWAQFPYDNVCDSQNQTYVKPQTYVVTQTLKGKPFQRNITVDEQFEVEFCRQNWQNALGGFFPPTPRMQGDLKWMSGSQPLLATIYGWTGCIVAVLFVLFWFGRTIVNTVMSLFRGTSTPRGQNQHIDFR